MIKKYLGQNFLVDKNMVRKIASYIVLENNNIEIGPGRGALTEAVLKNNPNCSLKLIEKDHALIDFLKQSYDNVICADCLDCDLNCDVIFSSLPYNISSSFILKLCESVQYKKCYLILQMDFINRLIAKPSKEYGALSVLAQLHAKMKLLCSISNQCFYPIPNVLSGFLLLEFQQSLSKGFIDFVFKCFAGRRKKLRNVVKVNCDLRADQIFPEEYLVLYDEYRNLK